jgi:hypothetical protein
VCFPHLRRRKTTTKLTFFFPFALFRLSFQLSSPPPPARSLLPLTLSLASPNAPRPPPPPLPPLRRPTTRVSWSTSSTPPTTRRRRTTPARRLAPTLPRSTLFVALLRCRPRALLTPSFSFSLQVSGNNSTINSNRTLLLDGFCSSAFLGNASSCATCLGGGNTTESKGSFFSSCPFFSPLSHDVDSRLPQTGRLSARRVVTSRPLPLSSPRVVSPLLFSVVSPFSLSKRSVERCGEAVDKQSK